MRMRPSTDGAKQTHYTNNNSCTRCVCVSHHIHTFPLRCFLTVWTLISNSQLTLGTLLLLIASPVHTASHAHSLTHSLPHSLSIFLPSCKLLKTSKDQWRLLLSTVVILANDDKEVTGGGLHWEPLYIHTPERRPHLLCIAAVHLFNQ